MNKIDIQKIEDGKYALFIDGKRACVGNLAAVVATINVNIHPIYDYTPKDYSINEK